jgi:ribonuclease D
MKKISLYIDTPTELEKIIPLLEAEQEGLAVDTEADSLYSYQERVCLLQISTREHNFVIDPIRLSDLSSVLEILAKKPLIFHGADYDVSSLKREYDLHPVSIFDTMLASWLLGYGQISLANLAEARLGVVLTKTHQTDNWKQRPLTTSMISYAQEDTAHLHLLRDQLVKELQDRQMEDAAREEFQWVMNRELRKLGFDPEGYKQLKGYRDLAPEARAALRALYIWRDERAKEEDVPPFRILRNEILFRLAEHRPIQRDTLRRFVPMPAFERYQRALLTILQKIPPLPLEPPKERKKIPPLLASEAGKTILTKLKLWRDETAKALGTESSVVATSAFLEGILIYQPKTTDELLLLPNARVWRVKRFGQSLLDCFWSLRPQEL